MITVKQLANTFEKGLNKILGNPEIQFKIWANAGEYQSPVRQGNTVTHEIIGNLRTTTSANDANNVLIMGVNALSLEFLVPVYPPRTNAEQTAAALEKIQDSQYPFLEYIINAINAYFGRAQTVNFRETTPSGETEYCAAFQAGVAVPNNVGIYAKLGQSLPVTANIEIYFVENGTNSQSVKITVDGEYMPFQSVRCGRTAVSERDVYSGSFVSKCIVSSTVFSIDADYPLAKNAASQTAIGYVLDGEPNTAHFVGVDYGNGVNKLYFMCYNTVQSSAAGISVVGLTASFTEIADNKEFYNVPPQYGMFRFKYDKSSVMGTVPRLSFTMSAETNTFISGVGAKRRQAVAQTVQLTPASFDFDESEDKYIVTLITEEKVTITNASTNFESI